MQRLIDANALMRLLPSEEMVSKYTVANAPTVEAIPAEWLKAQIEKCQEISKTSKTVGFAILAETIKQWEKENEASID